MKGLMDQSFLVTGGGSGIGRGTCERLCEAGARIAVVDLVEENASHIADSLRDRGAKAVAIGCDVVDESAVISMVQTATSTLGDLRGVVTSAGVNLDDDRQPLPEASVDAFDRVLSINLRGTFTVAKHTIPLLVDGGGGSFVMISSVAGMRGGAGEGFGYTASKGGVIALGQHLAARFGKHGVRVNSVCPGATSGEGMGAFFRTPEAAATVSRAIPMARVGTSEEIGAVAAFLLSDEASYLSGQFFAVDGGATAR